MGIGSGHITHLYFGSLIKRLCNLRYEAENWKISFPKFMVFFLSWSLMKKFLPFLQNWKKRTSISVFEWRNIHKRIFLNWVFFIIFIFLIFKNPLQQSTKTMKFTFLLDIFGLASASASADSELFHHFAPINHHSIMYHQNLRHNHLQQMRHEQRAEQRCLLASQTSRTTTSTKT